MPNFTNFRRTVLLNVRRFALPAAIALVALPAMAQPMVPGEEMPDPFVNSDCAAEPVTGSGPGFSNSRDASEDAARKAWGEKAIKIYPEATWDTAKGAGVSCVVQGLYSKCFAQAMPCRPKAGDAKSGDAKSDAAASDKAMPDAMGADEAAQASE
jgi:hypothetical protein